MQKSTMSTIKIRVNAYLAKSSKFEIQTPLIGTTPPANS
jgi:hypothetical protein